MRNDERVETDNKKEKGFKLKNKTKKLLGFLMKCVICVFVHCHHMDYISTISGRMGEKLYPSSNITVEMKNGINSFIV